MGTMNDLHRNLRVLRLRGFSEVKVNIFERQGCLLLSLTRLVQSKHLIRYRSGL